MLPVLVTCFSRPDLLEQSLSVLTKSEIPLQLFFNIDGPRKDSPNDLKAIQDCKAVIERFFGKRDIKVRCLEKNLGVREAMLSSITWFFEHVEYGLIIEEDIVIHPEAPKVVLSLLNEFKGNSQIGAISLHNNLPEYSIKTECHLFLSNLVFIWGWATWKDRWNCTSGGIENSYSRLVRCRINRKIGFVGFLYFLRFLNYKAKSSWDGDLLLNYWEKGYKTILFKENLAWNIGFDDRATHTKTTIVQRPLFAGQLVEVAKMSREMSTSLSIEKKIIQQVFGVKGVRTIFQYVKWFVRNWSALRN